MKQEKFTREEVFSLIELQREKEQSQCRRTRHSFIDVDYSDPRDSETYLMYPVELEAQDAITIHVGDLKRLEPGVYFNDNLIDLKIKFLIAELPPEKKSRIYAFSCLFLAKLTEIKGDEKAAHQLVSRWTKNVNIFSFDYLLFPINKSMHWSLVVVAFPGRMVTLPLAKFSAVSC